MSLSYSYPGIYIDEKDTGARPIQGVTTTTAAFIGLAPKADANRLKVKPVNSFGEFCDVFGATSETPNILANAVYGFFANGGSRCYVVNLGDDGPIDPALELIEPLDEVAMVAAPGRSDIASTSTLLAYCERVGDRFAILDAPGPDKVDLDALVRVGQEKGSATAVGDAPAGEAPGLRPPISQRGFGAQYFPWLLGRDALNPSRRDPIRMPPSGHVAGIYARTDTQRGVFKAPANEIVRGATGLAQSLTNSEQGKLNQAGINCIRYFSTQGILVWGARTLAPQGSNWTYVNVRRLVLFIEQSIYRSTGWVVFEPNDRPLWKSLRRDVSAFLTLLWRRGALMGATAEQAFFVKCDEETNRPENVDRGIVTTVIGIAPVKPAEFVVFEIGQMAGPGAGQ
ncbi:phage tail sheath family protein [Methylocapsa acidiphila]|uniref:phage tail sheath family protein n=1 Tax=Methylocapsa acidiphila TaxID=133552 RepID=UPI00042A2F0B|nr:phage tail sheath subtilisin-like domain-containing protein [Methylocapsa acidiphila]